VVRSGPVWTIENRLRGGVWLSDIAMGGDFIAYDIHIIDDVTWVMRKRPVRVCGSSRRCRLEPHGDRADSATMVFEYDDGLLWTHVTQALDNNANVSGLSASFFGLAATAHSRTGHCRAAGQCEESLRGV